MKNYKDFLNRKDETWQQALKRFDNFCEADMKEYFPEKDYTYKFSNNESYKIHLENKVSQQTIADFEANYNIKVPQALVDLVCNFGSFRIGDTIFKIYDEIDANTILTLSEILSLYGYDQFKDQIKPDVLKSLNTYYFFWGVSFPYSDEISYLFFNKAGIFGKMLFAPNNHNLVLQKVLPNMFNGNIDKYTLDSLISNQIDRVIINALTVRGYIQ